VKDPREALAAARRAASGGGGAAGGGRGTGGEGDTGTPPWSPSPDSARRLAEWAIIEPEAGRVYSTRRYGRPITAVKLLLVRLLRQYIGQVSAQQSRFNAQVAAHVLRLEERVAELEREAAARDTAARDTGPRDTAARDAGPRHTAPRDAGPRHTAPRGEPPAE
jgi:hypothetical protein